uniref:Uncharacterized protein n=1 Tax=Tanacetum cinerariifolium TaxID=118510 RepID=A0A6L2N1Z8_TANCI|nr:hypothetical protein [Tanacetum cinerariifolium]
MKTCATLTQKVANLEQDKVAQALEIIKLKYRVRKLKKKRRSKSFGLNRLRKIGTSQRVKSSSNTVGRMEEDVTAVKEVNAAEPIVFVDEEVRPIFERKYNHVQTFLKSDRDEEPTKKRVAKETLLQVSFKKLRAEVEVEDVQNMLQIIPIAEFKVEALQVKYPLINWEIYFKGSRTY